MSKPYKRLRSLMHENDVSQEYLAEQILHRGVLYANQRLTAKRPWSMEDVYNILDAFHLPDSDIQKYFPRDGIERDEGNKTDFKLLRMKRHIS